ncbi:ATPase-activating ribosome biosynthesis protein [Cymbomonas tetramitiformis]|uniref:ATPase-activating ribosome biosynthesis protein n=1 Tax=Cymbomonas tetramitiformis TaxID=36881 RepID=A0AAE0L528_9CHLO|nr:ATPase-activating ribosome biosynthesis protein [Cymbomonas tetramitiformis]
MTFVRNDSKVFHFCRSKCHRNFKMKRNPRKVAWTKAYRRAHGKDLTEDSTFEFERRRNRPEKYNRVTVQKSVQAMKKVLDIRKARADRHWDNRMAGKKKSDTAEARKVLENEIHLVKAPPAQLAEDPEGYMEKLKVKVAAPQSMESMEE